MLDILEDHDHDDFRTTNNLPPLKDEDVLQSIVTHLKSSEHNLCPSPPDESSLMITRRKTYSRRQSPSPAPPRKRRRVSSPRKRRRAQPRPKRRRDSTWVSNVRNYLSEKTSKSPSRKRRLSELYEPYVPVPQTEKELDKFLLGVWGNDVSGPSFETDPQTAQEIEELKSFYDKKLCELKQNHKIHLSELAHLADTSCTAHEDNELVMAVNEAKDKIKCFDRLRFSLKEQVAEAILELIPEGLMLSKKLSRKSAGLLTRWFKQHFKYPYPTRKQKEDLARKCAITVERVSNWFINQRASTIRRARRKQCPCTRSRGRGRRRSKRKAKQGKRKRGRAKRKGKGRKKGRRKLVIRHVRSRTIRF